MKTLLELPKKNSEDIFENKNIGSGEQLYHCIDPAIIA